MALLLLLAVLGCSSEIQTATTSADAAGDQVQQAQTATPAPSDPGVPARVGVWKPVTADLGGAKLPDSVIQGMTLTLTAETYEATIADGQETDKGTYKLDENANPKRITITSTDGPNPGKIQLAIYEIKDASSLRICYDLTGQEFPREFKSEQGTQLFLVDYQRQKKPQVKETTPK